RKVAGVLTEMRAEPDRVSHAAIGIGINVNLTSSDFPQELRDHATSLAMEAGRPVCRSSLAVSILQALEQDYRRILSGRFEEVAREWADQCVTLGQQVRVRQWDVTVCGRAESMDAEGALMLRTADGNLQRITGGDVTLEKTPTQLP
ncbi:MAG TPA: biotin--[acetyl-CoA-carboxylase] ligase, partial [Verrucomicrobiales bacterium]|nr:biotin--[acetyl-CoA-carboxylase] ligase [Verrucomicrobiales bacterium]